MSKRQIDLSYKLDLSWEEYIGEDGRATHKGSGLVALGDEEYKYTLNATLKIVETKAGSYNWLASISGIQPAHGGESSSIGEAIACVYSKLKDTINAQINVNLAKILTNASPASIRGWDK